MRTITVESLEEALRAGQPGTVVDIRPSDAFEKGHIDGSISLPQLMRVHRWEIPGTETDAVSGERVTKVRRTPAAGNAIQSVAAGKIPDTGVANPAGGGTDLPGTGADEMVSGVSAIDMDDPASVAHFLERSGVDQGKPVWVVCHTGERSEETADDLEAAGFDAYNVLGGYRAYLAYTLRKQAAAQTEMQQRRMEIERSIIKKFRKQLWCRFTKAVRDYQLISQGDKIAVCISGGKDSMLMAKLIQELHAHGPVKFDVVYLCMNPGYNEENWSIIENNAKILGIPLTVFHSDIFDSVANVDKHPCYLCARMRRGYLYNNAKQLGCNKIALGHHYDDVIETILMGILYAGKTETMMPKLHSQNFPGMELIRPMYLIREADVKKWRDFNGLHFIQCACRFTDTCSVVGGNTSSKRAQVKQLIAQLSKDDPVIEQNIFNCVRDINLRTVIGYHKDGAEYNFLDDYHKYDT